MKPETGCGSAIRLRDVGDALVPGRWFPGIMSDKVEVGYGNGLAELNVLAM